MQQIEAKNSKIPEGSAIRPGVCRPCLCVNWWGLRENIIAIGAPILKKINFSNQLSTQSCF